MPKLEPKQIQKELEDGLFWPVYWIFGSEKMKSRELVKRIRKALLGEGGVSGGFGLNEERMDGSSLEAASVVDAAQSLTLGGGVRLIIIQDSHELKSSDEIEVLFGPRIKKAEVTSVCIFLSKDLDQRKKLSKRLLEKAAVVSCEDVLEGDRPAWIEYLAKQRGIEIDPNLVAQISLQDPWSLDIVDQELEKLSLSKDSTGTVLLSAAAHSGATDRFVEAFFARELKPAIETLDGFASEPEQAIPLLGLLGWNVRQLATSLSSSSTGAGRGRPHPFLADRLARWGKLWTLNEVEILQEALCDVDFSSKQTARLPLGIWTDLVVSFCH